MERQSSGRKYPSMSGRKYSRGCFSAILSSFSAGMARNASIEFVPNAAWANFTPAASASVRDFGGMVALKKAPLSPMARWKRPCARGDAISALTENEPADSPKIVTLSGSPPKVAMLFLTHSSAAT
jgi:hypothetical protein